jgi:predicted transcriptional regulator
MLAKDLISEVISPLQSSDIGAKGLHRMEAFRISHLPVVNQDDLLGLVSDVDIFDCNRADLPVGEYPLSPSGPFVYEYQHLYEVIELVSRLNLTAVPVLTDKQKYLGVITVQQLIQSIGNMVVNIPGGIIVLELNTNDYSLTQIARIVEDNDAKILSSYITSPADSMKMEVTLKINRVDLTFIIQSFLRYDYTIKASFQSSSRNEDILRNNYDQFMMYLNV